MQNDEIKNNELRYIISMNSSFRELSSFDRKEKQYEI